MSFSVTALQGVTISGVQLSQAVVLTSDTLYQNDIAVANGASNYAVDFAATVARIKLFYIESDFAVTLETNDGTTPDESIVLVANQPYLWYVGCQSVLLLETDITGLFFTNASGSAATVKIRCLYDATAA